jgi:hypothetical protein
MGIQQRREGPEPISDGLCFKVSKEWVFFLIRLKVDWKHRKLTRKP